jgi:hypothetical protein
MNAKRKRRRKDWRTVATPSGRLTFVERHNDSWLVHVGLQSVGTVGSEEAAVTLAEKFNRGAGDER